jgi:hypothetical protein
LRSRSPQNVEDEMLDRYDIPSFRGRGMPRGMMRGTRGLALRGGRGMFMRGGRGMPSKRVEKAMVMYKGTMIPIMEAV